LGTKDITITVVDKSICTETLSSGYTSENVQVYCTTGSGQTINFDGNYDSIELGKSYTFSCKEHFIIIYEPV
jgi:hypothetical protein